MLKRLIYWLWPPSDVPRVTSRRVLARLEAVENELTQLRMEWDKTLDRVQSYFGRENARKRRRIEQSVDGASSEPVSQGEAAPAIPAANLTKSQLRGWLAQQKLARG